MSNKQDTILFIIFMVIFMVVLFYFGYVSTCMNRAKDLGLFGQGIGEWQCMKNPFSYQ